MNTVKLKLSKMRKADECIVYPGSSDDGNWLRFQGDRLVGMVDAETGKARINYKHGSSYPAFHHLQNGMKGLELIIIDKETIELIKAAQPRSGNRIGVGVYIA
jgi:hypothetical protein